MSKQCAVVDTSCVIGYYLGSKSLDRLAIDHLGKVRRLLVSEETLSEFREVVLRTKFDRIPRNLRLAFVDNYRSLADVIAPHVEVNACIDPKDDKFLSLGLSGNASLLLTNDDHLLRLHPFQSIRILTPKQYLEEQAVPANPR